jgi:hypothetical protein
MDDEGATTSAARPIASLGQDITHSPTARRTLRRGNFASKDMLKTRIEQFIAYFNATMAKPFRWTYAGKPLAG